MPTLIGVPYGLSPTVQDARTSLRVEVLRALLAVACAGAWGLVAIVLVAS